MARHTHQSGSKLPPRGLLSDQVSKEEIRIIVRELEKTDRVVGDVVEFGCYIGTTSVFLAHHLMTRTPAKKLFLYDSFAGLPPKSEQDHSPAGLQFKAGELAASKKTLIANLRRAGVPMPHITKAWFSDLTESAIPQAISFAFLDGDYYHSIRDPLRLIWPHLSAGAIVVVDDYANEALPGAAKAVDEWLQTHPATKRVEASLAILQIR